MWKIIKVTLTDIENKFGFKTKKENEETYFNTDHIVSLHKSKIPNKRGYYQDLDDGTVETIREPEYIYGY